MADRPDRPIRVDLAVPDELEAGVYANFAAAWHTTYEFTVDFAVIGEPGFEDPDDPDSPPVVGGRLVARVKIPLTLIFTLMRDLSLEMAAYESEYGEIRGPEQRGGAR